VESFVKTAPRLKRRWASCKTIFRRATATPKALGEGDWVRSKPLRAIFVLVRQANKGRRGKNANGKRARSNVGFLKSGPRFLPPPSGQLFHPVIPAKAGISCCVGKGRDLAAPR
jgi:hypothetical protein